MKRHNRPASVRGGVGRMGYNIRKGYAADVSGRAANGGAVCVPANGLTDHPIVGERAHKGHPRKRHTDTTGKHGGVCSTMPAKRLFRSRRQVASRGAERQRRFAKRLKAGDAFGIPSALREPPPPRPKRQGWMSTGLPKLRRALGFLGEANKGCVPPKKGLKPA